MPCSISAREATLGRQKIDAFIVVVLPRSSRCRLFEVSDRCRGAASRATTQPAPNEWRHGGQYRGPTLWLYGNGDPYYSIEHSRENFAAFEKMGGRGTFLDFDVPGGFGHAVIGYPDLWSDPIGKYLDSIAVAEQR